MSTNILGKEDNIRRNILLDRIADALEKQNELKEKELEFIHYQSEIMLKQYELDLKKNTISEKGEQTWQDTL